MTSVPVNHETARDRADRIRTALLDTSGALVPGTMSQVAFDALSDVDALLAELAGLRTALDAKPDVQRDVADFHSALDIPCGESPEIRRPELRASLIEEEAEETCWAIRNGNLIEAIDGMCDLLCVTYGAAVEFGINLAPFWDEVHRTNMAKVGGPVREDGKRLKPEGWKPPDIAGVLTGALAVSVTPPEGEE